MAPNSRIQQHIKDYQIIKTKVYQLQVKMSSTLDRNYNIKHSSAISDGQQQLRSLVALLEQYSQHYNELMNEHRQTIKDTHTFEDFILKAKTRPESEIHSLYDGMKNIRKMIEEIFSKCLMAMPDIVRDFSEYRSRLQNIQEQLDDKDLIIQGLRQQKQQRQKHIADITNMYERSRFDNVQLNEKISQKQQQFQTESQQIRKTFMQVTESSQMEKKILQELYDSNQKLAISLNEAKNQKKFMNKQMQIISAQLAKAKSKIENLEVEINKKQMKIKEFETQFQSIYKKHRKQSAGSMVSNHNSNEDQEANIRQSFTEPLDDKRNRSKTKLNQQLDNYKMPTVKELNGSFIGGSGIKRSIGQESDYAEEEEKEQHGKINRSGVFSEEDISKNQNKSAIKKKDISDPYFSHYILISQSVKIKEDCQDMLNIDMKPYYQEIIDKRIPMHLWDQWIKNRLRELLRKNQMIE